MLVGLAIMGGGLAPRRRWLLFIAGLMTASAATILAAAPLSAPLGRPTPLQLESLLVAVIIEFSALAWLGRRMAGATERQRILSILLIVGVHFVLMAPAFGPLVVLLSVLSTANAIAGLRSPAIPLQKCWVLDGALKAGVGGTMLWLAPRTTW